MPSIERLVAAFTPAFAAVAGLVTGAVGQLVPGVNLSQTDVTALFVTGATAATAAALKWLHGRSKFTQIQSDVDQVADAVVAKIKANPVAGPAAADIEELLKAHTDQIVQAIGGAVHAPPSASQVADEILDRAGQARVPAPTGPTAVPDPTPPTAV